MKKKDTLPQLCSRESCLCRDIDIEIHLRAVDAGTLKGQFELHFGVKLKLKITINPKVCHTWELMVTNHAIRNSLHMTDTSPELDAAFDRFFGVKEKEDKRFTLERWEAWKNHLILFVEEIKSRRQPDSTGPRHDDAS